MTVAGTISPDPSAARGKAVYAKEGPPVIRPVGVTIGEGGVDSNSAFRYGLPEGQGDIARCNLAADGSDLGTEVVEVDQKSLVLPAVRCPGMAHGAAIATVG